MDMRNAAKKAAVTFHPHFVKRWKTREMDIGRVEDTIRTGKVFKSISRKKKLGLKKYYGKENETYSVIVIVEEGFVEVRTAWKAKGR